MARNKRKIIRSVTVPISCVFFSDVMRKLRDMDYEMVALSSPGPDLDNLKEEGFHCVEVPMERHISLLKDLKAFCKMVKVLRKEKPYMIHSITPKAGLLSMTAGWLAGVPVRVHTFTGLVWPTSTGLSRRILMTTDKILCACATHIIPEGAGVMNDLKNGGITKKPMKVLGYGNVMGVDMERFDPARFADVEKDDSVFTFVYVGRIVKDKGINELVEAFTKLQDKYHKARLVLVGRYESDLDPVEQVTLDRIKANPAIAAIGPQYGDDLLREYKKADCFVMPSYREGFPNTVMEAGAMGLPSVVTDINGSREIVISEENGLIVPPQAVLPLYEAMERMMNDDDARERMAGNARNMIVSRFERSFVQKCLIDYYKEILKDNE